MLLVDPLYAVAVTAMVVVSTFLVWHLTRDAGTAASDRAASFDRSDPTRRTGSDCAPVTKLQDRYAAGDLSDAEFERKLERSTEANQRADEAGIETDDLDFERSDRS